MTIKVDINGHDALSELVAHIDAGEDLVLLTRDGQTVAVAHRPEPKVAQGDRIPGVWAHLGPMDDPDLFLRPDPEFAQLAEAHDEDEFYRPSTPKE